MNSKKDMGIDNLDWLIGFAALSIMFLLYIWWLGLLLNSNAI